MKKRFAVFFLVVIMALFLPLGFAEELYVDITDESGTIELAETESEIIYVDIKEVSYLETYRSDLLLLEHIPNEVAKWFQNITIQNFNNESTVHMLNVWRDSNLSIEFLQTAEYVSVGFFGTYDYELRIPTTLDTFGPVSRYDELK
jgi:hypothetical protein